MKIGIWTDLVDKITSEDARFCQYCIQACSEGVQKWNFNSCPLCGNLLIAVSASHITQISCKILDNKVCFWRSVMSGRKFWPHYKSTQLLWMLLSYFDMEKLITLRREREREKVSRATPKCDAGTLLIHNLITKINTFIWILASPQHFLFSVAVSLDSSLEFAFWTGSH